MEKMELISFRVPASLKKWIKEQAEKENMPYTTMARVLLDRMKYTDEIINQLVDKKKKVK